MTPPKTCVFSRCIFLVDVREGHITPAVTLGLLLSKRVTINRACFYFGEASLLLLLASRSAVRCKQKGLTSLCFNIPLMHIKSQLMCISCPHVWQWRRSWGP